MLADSYDVLVGHVKRIFERTGDLMWPGQVELYVKPTNHAPHKKYVLLASDSSEMRLQLETIWHKARLRKHDHTAFVLLLFVYLPRRQSQRLTSLRRDTDSRTQEQLPRVIAHMQEHQISGGAATHRYVAISQARLPDDTPIQVPDNATFRQLQHIDRRAADSQSDLREQENGDQGFRLVRARIHGVVLPIYLHMGDMHDGLKLPSYGLRPPLRPPREFDTSDPEPTSQTLTTHKNAKRIKG
ncbi:hypothetical protein PI124_g8132 [Phytophthora idaei]|nr:hypothetical protein PI125_g14156 [Phytophthora idaei]KAG3149116.1 hypothetical protein PI126_g12177 [Phytophthora idaei]KAG3247166.1 hypothetical protein PI124_g8132 [Phytophthora idaei]